MDWTSLLTHLPLVVLFWALYMTPFLVAAKYRHHNMASIFVINFFFGWTVVGWVACFAWALSKKRVVA